VAAWSLKVFALTVMSLVVACDRASAAWSLHFDAARIDPAVAAVPVDEQAWRPVTAPGENALDLRERQRQAAFRNALDMIVLHSLRAVSLAVAAT